MFQWRECSLVIDVSGVRLLLDGKTIVEIAKCYGSVFQAFFTTGHTFHPTQFWIYGVKFARGKNFKMAKINSNPVQKVFQVK